jgi:hypothetical protein
MQTKQEKSIREIAIQEKENVTKHVNNFISQQKNIENYYDNFFVEISKVSNDFQLTKNKRTYSREVKYKHTNGKYITIGNVTEKYNECVISYVGKLPENTRRPINISVEEHIVYSRRYWGRRSEGLKLALRFNHDDPIFYKTGKGLVKKITEKVDSIWTIHNNELIAKDKRNLAIKKLSEKFKDCSILNSDSVMIHFSFKNSVRVKLYYTSDLETGKVVFRLANIDFASAIKNDETLMELMNFSSNI